MPSATPADVLARRSQLILNGDADGFAALFAPEAVIESSFAGPPGTPVRLAGREAIREYSRRVMASPLRIEAAGRYVLGEAEQSGHTCLPTAVFAQNLTDTL